MLVAQGVIASEIFFDTKYDDETYARVFKALLSEKENIVLIGMPSSGKTTVGRIISERLSRPFIDTDKLIEAKASITIPEIFEKYGDSYFRELESEIIKEASAEVGKIIATGGGAVLRRENRAALSENGRIYFIDRPLEMLIPTKDRPLSFDEESLKRRFEERYEIYTTFADKRINGDIDPSSVAGLIINDFLRGGKV